jgi:broad specificity phosphatase PhoE
MSIPSKMLPRVYLVRHGETAWSLTGQHTGRTDVPLTSRGEHDAKGLATALQGVQFRHVMTSPLQRASSTCALAQCGLSATTNLNLAEWDYGDYEGLTPSEVRAIRPGWNVFDDGCPGGETPAQVELRADSIIAHVRTLDGAVGLFTHGHIGRVIAARWIGLSGNGAKHFLLGTASFGILSFAHDNPAEPAIQSWNIGQLAAFEQPLDALVA